MVVRDFRRDVTTNQRSDFIRSQRLAVSLFFDDFASSDHYLEFWPGTGSPLSSHAVYQRLPSIVAPRASSVEMKSVPFARGAFGLNSPDFSRSYIGSRSAKPCARYCLIESQTLASRCGGCTFFRTTAISIASLTYAVS